MSKNNNQIRIKKEESIKNSRRNFIRNSAIGAFGISIIPRHVLGRGFVAPSDRVNVGIIGLGKQIRWLGKNFIESEDWQVVACSDVWTTKMDWYKEMVLLGCVLNRFPQEYVNVVASVGSIKDPKRSRARANWKIVDELRNAI